MKQYNDEDFVQLPELQPFGTLNLATSISLLCRAKAQLSWGHHDSLPDWICAALGDVRDETEFHACMDLQTYIARCLMHPEHAQSSTLSGWLLTMYSDRDVRFNYDSPDFYSLIQAHRHRWVDQMVTTMQRVQQVRLPPILPFGDLPPRDSAKVLRLAKRHLCDGSQAMDMRDDTDVWICTCITMAQDDVLPEEVSLAELCGHLMDYVHSCLHAPGDTGAPALRMWLKLNNPGVPFVSYTYPDYQRIRHMWLDSVIAALEAVAQ